jgi:hypothetical protein
MKQAIKLTLCMIAISLISACNLEYKPSEDAESSDGTISPTADFIVQNNHLITIESTFIKVYSLADPAKPLLEQTYSSTDDLELETLYAYKTNMLMIGTKTGTYFKDHSTAGKLDDVSFSKLFTSCDSFVTQGNYMYMTLRGDQDCSSTNNSQDKNQLLVYNIIQVDQPNLIKSIDIDKPYGLGTNVGGTKLFACYEQGILEFDLTVPTAPVLKGDYSQQCNDIIATEDPMVLTDEDGIRLVEYAGPGLTELSIIRKGE